jgi:hypothetical protein
LARYRAHLDRRPEVVAEIRQLAAEAPAALLCAEADPALCHRSVIARKAASRALAITNL